MMRREGLDGYLDWVLSGPLFRWSSLLDGWRIPKVVWTFLLGVCAGREIVAGRLLGERRRLWWIFLGGTAIGLPASLLLAWVGGLPFMEISSRGLAATTLYAVGVTPLGAAYAAGFALFWHRGRRLLRGFCPAGRMALTNYLLQSVLGILVFYGIGLGLAGRLAPAAWLTVGLAIYAGQLVLSYWWLHRHRFGPVEWLWRCSTYGRWFALRSLESALGA